MDIISRRRDDTGRYWIVTDQRGVEHRIPYIAGGKDPDGEEFATIVKGEMKAVEDRLRQGFSDEIATKFSESNATLEEIRTELDKFQRKGDAPDSETVKELETKINEIESSVQNIVTRVSSLPQGGGGSKSKEDRDIELFEKSFLVDRNELKTRLRSMRLDDKAVRAIDSDLFSTGGKLSAETADRFLDFVIEKTVALSRVTTRRMMSPEGKTDELTLSTRKLRAGVEGVEPNVADGIGTRRRSLTTVEIIWPENITLTFLEDNIERAGAESHIARLLGMGFGNDLNDLAWNGTDEEDSTGGDDFLNINNGWIRLMQQDSLVNDVDASGLSTPTNTDILSEAYRALPDEFLARPDLGFFVPVKFAQRYAEEVSTRETALGDQVLVNGFPALRYFGIPVVPEPHLYLTNVDKLVLTPFPNLYHGIQRSLMIDSEWQPRTRVVEYTLSARNDYEYATGAGIVLVSSIPADNR